MGSFVFAQEHITSDTLWFNSCYCAHKTESIIHVYKSSSSSVNCNLQSNSGLSWADIYYIYCCYYAKLSFYTSSDKSANVHLTSMTENVK